MGGRASRRKGHDWERAVAKRLRAIFGTAVRRGWQSRDGAEQPDVDGSPWWVECKRSKRPNIEAALVQAEGVGLLALATPDQLRRLSTTDLEALEGMMGRLKDAENGS